jgi:hypothetical protein
MLSPRNKVLASNVSWGTLRFCLFVSTQSGISYVQDQDEDIPETDTHPGVFLKDRGAWVVDPETLNVHGQVVGVIGPDEVLAISFSYLLDDVKKALGASDISFPTCQDVDQERGGSLSEIPLEQERLQYPLQGTGQQWLPNRRH